MPHAKRRTPRGLGVGGRYVQQGAGEGRGLRAPPPCGSFLEGLSAESERATEGWDEVMHGAMIGPMIRSIGRGRRRMISKKYGGRVLLKTTSGGLATLDVRRTQTLRQGEEGGRYDTLRPFEKGAHLRPSPAFETLVGTSQQLKWVVETCYSHSGKKPISPHQPPEFPHFQGRGGPRNILSGTYSNSKWKKLRHATTIRGWSPSACVSSLAKLLGATSPGFRSATSIATLEAQSTKSLRGDGPLRHATTMAFGARTNLHRP